MKKIYTSSVIVLFFLLSLNFAFCQNPTFNLTARNFQYSDSLGTGGFGFDAVTFDICIQHTNYQDSGPFEFIFGQYFFNVNKALGVSADYTYYIIPGSSEFSSLNYVPRNPLFVSPDSTSPLGATLRLSSNAVLEGNGTTISTVLPGTRVCKMRFKKKTGSIPNVLFNMTWRRALPNPFTKIFAYLGTTSIEISSSGTYSIDFTPMPSITLFNPPDNSISNPIPVNFIWSSKNSVTGYQLKIYTDSLMLNNVRTEILDKTDTSFILKGLSRNTKYFWRVGYKNYKDVYYYSLLYKFTTSSGLKLKLTAIPEGTYFEIFNKLSRRDTFFIYLRNADSPYSKADSSKTVIDSLSFKGYCLFQNAYAGNYFIQIRHFNTVETWSKPGGISMLFTDTAYYDFTSSVSQAYGNNQKLIGGKYCLFSGDLDQNGIIDASDMSRVMNDSYYGLMGRFLISDVNGDGIVDISDVVIVNNNTGVIVVKP